MAGVGLRRFLAHRSSEGFDWPWSITAAGAFRTRCLARLAPGEQPLQVGELDRLRQVMVETRLLGTAAVLFLAPARQGDQHQARAALELPDPARHLVAVELRQADV